MYVCLCVWISVIRCITGLINENLGFFLVELLFSDSVLQGCLGQWSSQPLPLLSTSLPCILHISGVRPQWGESQAGEGSLAEHLVSCPSTHPVSPPLLPTLCISRPHIQTYISQPSSALRWQPHCSVLLSFWIFQSMRKHLHVNCLHSPVSAGEKTEYSAYDTSFKEENI